MCVTLADMRYLVYEIGVSFKGCKARFPAAYKLWADMIRRCYSKKSALFYLYGARDVKVCDRWLEFKNFLLDLPSVAGYEAWILDSGVHLDKDLLVPGNKVYGPGLVQFISASKNTAGLVLDRSVWKYFVDGNVFRTLKEAALALGVTESRVCQVFTEGVWQGHTIGHAVLPLKSGYKYLKSTKRDRRPVLRSSGVVYPGVAIAAACLGIPGYRVIAKCNDPKDSSLEWLDTIIPKEDITED